MKRNTRIRLAVATGMAGAALVALPAFAGAAPLTASTCQLNPDNHTLIVTDLSGGSQLRLLRGGGTSFIMLADSGDGVRTMCPVRGGGTFATVNNTERIAVFAAPQHVPGGYMIDQNNGRFAPGLTNETDGDSEVEITLNTTGTPAELTVAGTPQNDVISVGTGGRVNFAYDLDADVEPQTKPKSVVVTGGVGNDELDSSGGSMFSPPADVEVDLRGDADNDSIVATGAHTILRGGSGDDRLFSANGHSDGLTGGIGFDVATTDKSENIPFGDIEQRHILDQVGQLRLASAVVDARAGKPTRLKVSWTHPKAWKQLNTIALRLGQGADTIGTVTIKPGSGRVQGDGAVRLLAADSRLTHRGKTVTAELAMRLPQSLAGQNLSVEVEATDRNGHRQSEPLAGHIRLAK